MPYSLDTSALIDAWDRFYPPPHFPSLWQKVEQGIADGELVAIDDEVQEELSKRSEEIHDWMTEKGLFVPISADVQESIREILELRPQLVGAGAGRGRADPFVIALARVNEYTVVTHENRSIRRDAAKIPNVCEHYDIRYIDFPTLVIEMGWTFRHRRFVLCYVDRFTADCIRSHPVRHHASRVRPRNTLNVADDQAPRKQGLEEIDSDHVA